MKKEKIIFWSELVLNYTTSKGGIDKRYNKSCWVIKTLEKENMKNLIKSVMANRLDWKMAVTTTTSLPSHNTTQYD